MTTATSSGDDRDRRDRDYATAATERLLMKYDENDVPLTHLGQLQLDIRLAITAAMEAQREATIKVVKDYYYHAGDEVRQSDILLLLATVTVKSEEKR